MVSVIPRVDLLENTEMNLFCILSLFGLDTLLICMSEGYRDRLYTRSPRSVSWQAWVINL